jgi:hypothetical protein
VWGGGVHRHVRASLAHGVDDGNAAVHVVRVDEPVAVHVLPKRRAAAPHVQQPVLRANQPAQRLLQHGPSHVPLEDAAAPAVALLPALAVPLLYATRRWSIHPRGTQSVMAVSACRSQTSIQRPRAVDSR